MTENKDFKRLVRRRMAKTGESYTTARAHLLRKTGSTGSADSTADDYATVAGMSDEAVEAKTGRDWKEWIDALDGVGASEWSHRDIAAHVGENYDVSGWWAQMLTVGYERIKGLRDVGQRRDGTYETNKSRTFPVPVERLYRAFSEADERQQWLPETDLEIRKATPDESMRITWQDGSSVEVYFNAKGPSKSQVAVQHRKLDSEEQREERKRFWSERLGALAAALTG